MQKKGRPKIYYDFSDSTRKYQVEEPLDLLLKEGTITITQHKLALKLRWMFTLNFGLPTVQAYNTARVKGREISKYDESTLYEIRHKYKQIIEFLYCEDKESTKAILNVIIHHKQRIGSSDLIKTGMENLEIAFNSRKKEYNTINNSKDQLKTIN